MNKAEMLDRLDADNGRWEALLAEIGEARMTEPGVAGPWSVKDIIAHLTGWRKRSVARLQAAGRGEPEPPTPWPAPLQTDDEINAWIYEQNRDLPLAAVLADSRQTYADLRAALQALPDSDFTDPQRFAWTEGTPLAEVHYFSHFQEEHEPDIRAWLTAQAPLDGGQAAPRADRPQMPKGYGVPESGDGLLPWSFARELLEGALLYWVGTTRPDGRPHAVPIWGVWLDDAFWFEGGPDTRRGRNLAANPATVVHVERADDVVIVEGTTESVPDPDSELAARLVEAFAAKYEPKYNYRPDPKMWEGDGLYRTQPRVVLAWSHFPSDCTRWHFAAG